MTIEGYTLVGIYKNVNYYFSKTHQKFVNDIMKLTLKDLFSSSAKQNVDLDKIKLEHPLFSDISWTKIKIDIEI